MTTESRGKKKKNEKERKEIEVSRFLTSISMMNPNTTAFTLTKSL